jgi:hypothetical protein
MSHAAHLLAIAGPVAEEAPSWSPAKTLRFVFATCGTFWLIAIAAFVTFH